MSCVKQTISAANPCRICGKPDYCYRLVFDTNETLHCCARVSEKAVTSSYGTFIWKKSKDTSIGVYNYYQEESEAERPAPGERGYGTEGLPSLCRTCRIRCLCRRPHHSSHDERTTGKEHCRDHPTDEGSRQRTGLPSGSAIPRRDYQIAKGTGIKINYHIFLGHSHDISYFCTII